MFVVEEVEKKDYDPFYIACNLHKYPCSSSNANRLLLVTTFKRYSRILFIAFIPSHIIGSYLSSVIRMMMKRPEIQNVVDDKYC